MPVIWKPYIEVYLLPLMLKGQMKTTQKVLYLLLVFVTLIYPVIPFCYLSYKMYITLVYYLLSSMFVYISKGDYDPRYTKVLHFSMNPHALAQRTRAQQLTQLQEENERLRKRLQVLEETGGQVRVNSIFFIGYVS
jgi:hypothetical protein